MASVRGARERARAEITQAIVEEARRQLAQVGPGALSLRSIARELGVASSALYRYFASRDDLLTALIVEAYDALGERAERASAAAAGRDPAERWCAVAGAIRRWALENPHQYALLYGSPVPDYHAPQATIGPASRVSLALVGVVDDAHRAGRLCPPAGRIEPSETVMREAARLLATTSFALPAEVFWPLALAWTQLFGLVSFELFGQTHNVFTDHEAVFAYDAQAMAWFVGLP